MKALIGKALSKPKRHTARLYIIENTGNRQVYFEGQFRYWWVAYVACMITSLEVSDLMYEGIIKMEIDITPIQ